MRMRHYCDFCKKTGGSAKWMLKHEQACTQNPSRACRMCQLLQDEDHAPLADLVSTFLTEGYAAMRVKAGNCPACILAVIRQTDIPESWAWNDERIEGLSEFDFKAEVKTIFDAINENRNYERQY